MIAGIIDLILLVIILIFNVAVTKNLLALWFVIVIVADVLLIIGSMNANSGLLMVWMIIEMINIVFLFIGWLAMPIYAFVVIFATSVCNSNELNLNCGGKETGVLAYFYHEHGFYYRLTYLLHLLMDCCKKPSRKPSWATNFYSANSRLVSTIYVHFL